MKKFILTTIILTSLFGISNGQQASPDVLAAAGDFSTTSLCTMSWTVGEISVETFSNTQSILTQGFHQPDIFYLSVREKIPTTGSMLVYPNPATDYFNIEMSGFEMKDVTIELVDLTGKSTIISPFITSNNSVKDKTSLQLNISSLAAGTYMLHIYSDDCKVNMIYKLIKY